MSELANQFRYNNERVVNEIRNFCALPGETTNQRHSRLARLIVKNPTIMHGEMAVGLFLKSYPKSQHKPNWELLCRQPGNTAQPDNWTLKHVADVIHEEKNAQAWSEM